MTDNAPQRGRKAQKGSEAKGGDQRRGRSRRRAGSRWTASSDSTAVGSPPPPSKSRSRVARYPRRAAPPPDPPPADPAPTSGSALRRAVGASFLVVPYVLGLLCLIGTTMTLASIRPEVAILRVPLGEQTWRALYSKTQGLSPAGGNEGGGGVLGVRGLGKDANRHVATSASIASRANEGATVGTLEIGVWGWCVRDENLDKTACSSLSPWWNLDDLLFGSPDPALKIPGVVTNMLHGLFIHGLALLATCVAGIPVGMYCWKRYKQDDQSVRPGWFLYGLLIPSAVLSCAAWADDKVLLLLLSNDLPGFNLTAGFGTTLMAVAMSMLVWCLAFVACPALWRRIKAKKTSLKNASTLTSLSVAEQGAAPTGTVTRGRKQSRPGG